MAAYPPPGDHNGMTSRPDSPLMNNLPNTSQRSLSAVSLPPTVAQLWADVGQQLLLLWAAISHNITEPTSVTTRFYWFFILFMFFLWKHLNRNWRRVMAWNLALEHIRCKGDNHPPTMFLDLFKCIFPMLNLLFLRHNDVPLRYYMCLTFLIDIFRSIITIILKKYLLLNPPDFT